MENPIQMDDLGGSFPPIFGNIQKKKIRLKNSEAK